MKHRDFDVIIVGGGHAGTEAAHAAARLGVSVALVTLTLDGLGVMSCNPAIGGLGKGHIVREIDAFDGIMGRAADAAGIQFRLLNRRKGPAVQGPRAQTDRALYRAFIKSETLAHPNISVVEGEVTDLLIESGRCAGVRLGDGSEVRSASVVLTTGTFLRGVIHIGDVSHPGGRIGEKPSTRLAERIEDLGLELGRLKTGTPPRLDGRTIAWDDLADQPGDDVATMFSFLSTAPQARQVSCGITETNETTHAIIRENLNRSAMYGGHIDGVGPRYCPSIEDKVVRFADKNSHQIFLEPEGLDDHTVYPNGISTSLPQDVQTDYVRSIRGLEQVEILQFGYAIEYDYVDPRALGPALNLKVLPGLFLAGQINGTTGYEEAAGQGLVAGLNAGLRAGGLDPMHLSRSDSYIGVMVDDLITRGVTEPYRMFTSRAEYRLSLRADNADQRLTPMAIGLGIVSDARRAAFESKAEKLDAARQLLTSEDFTPTEIKKSGIRVSEDGVRRSAWTLLAFPDVDKDSIRTLLPEVAAIETTIMDQVCRDALYSSYLSRQQEDIDAVRRDEAHEIPEEFDYFSLSGLSNELKAKLVRIKPRTLGQAGRVEGMTPAALTLILSHLRRQTRRSA